MSENNKWNWCAYCQKYIPSNYDKLHWIQKHKNYVFVCHNSFDDDEADEFEDEDEEAITSLDDDEDGYLSSSSDNGGDAGNNLANEGEQLEYFLLGADSDFGSDDDDDVHAADDGVEAASASERGASAGSLLVLSDDSTNRNDDFLDILPEMSRELLWLTFEERKSRFGYFLNSAFILLHNYNKESAILNACVPTISEEVFNIAQQCAFSQISLKQLHSIAKRDRQNEVASLRKYMAKSFVPVSFSAASACGRAADTTSDTWFKTTCNLPEPFRPATFFVRSLYGALVEDIRTIFERQGSKCSASTFCFDAKSRSVYAGGVTRSSPTSGGLSYFSDLLCTTFAHQLFFPNNIFI